MTYGDSINEDVFKEKVGQASVKQITRTAKERCPGFMGYAEAIMIFYNQKNKYHLSITDLHKKVKKKAEEVRDENIHG